MKDKSRALVNQFLESVPFEYRVMLNELAEYAYNLGYTPKRNKVSIFSIDFFKNKFKKTIMKLEAHDNCKNGIPSGIPGLRLKFYANDTYSDIFSDGIKRVIEAFSGKYTGCYGCGRCKGNLEGYTYEYPDGRKVFRCGGELIQIYNWSCKDVEEINRLLKTQDDFWARQSQISTV